MACVRYMHGGQIQVAGDGLHAVDGPPHAARHGPHLSGRYRAREEGCINACAKSPGMLIRPSTPHKFCLYIHKELGYFRYVGLQQSAHRAIVARASGVFTLGDSLLAASLLCYDRCTFFAQLAAAPRGTWY